jgi:hypothetical protein
LICNIVAKDYTFAKIRTMSCLPNYFVQALLPNCADDLIVYLPPDYAEATIDVFIVNGAGFSISYLAYVEDGNWVNIDLTSVLFPESFLNPWGGPYIIRFRDPDSNQFLKFTAKDGTITDSIQFSVGNFTQTETPFINAFTDVVPQGYGS